MDQMEQEPPHNAGVQSKVGQKKETKTRVKFEVHHINNKALRLKSGETQVPIEENLGASNGSFNQESSPR